jgi:SAM-dependent methyltransferase
MGGFSAEWLRGREPADAAARDLELTARALDWRRRRGLVNVLDLGSGTGANLRFLARRFDGAQRWLLVDHDSELLARGFEEIRAWATRQGLAAAEEGTALVMEDAGCHCRLEPVRLDLAGDWEQLEAGEVDLVTASALLDLVGVDWLERLAERCRAWRAAVFVVLSYDGSIAWEPVLAGDATLRERVNRHQRTDKGFGPALGPDAAATLAALLQDWGYQVALRPSPWRLGPEHAALQTALLEDWSEAAREIEPAADDLTAWALQRRRWIDRGESRLRVGHWDLFACPDGD